MKKTGFLLGILLLTALVSFFVLRRSVVWHFALTERGARVCGYLVSGAGEICQKDPQQFFERFSERTPQKDALRFRPEDSDADFRFQPRDELHPVVVSPPFDWSSDPYHDSNWRMSLNSWRSLDSLLVELDQKGSGQVERMNKILKVVDDWYDFHVVRKQRHFYAWYDMSLAYRADRLTWIFSHPELLRSQAKEELWKLLHLAWLHLTKLSDQEEIALSNHSIFQWAARQRLCKMISEFRVCDESAEWAKGLIGEIFHQQFGEDGLHREHSPSYHFFSLNQFEALISEGLLKLNGSDEIRLQKARELRGWLVKPDGRVSTLGDSGTSVRESDRLDFDQPQTFSIGGQDLVYYRIFPKGGLAVVQSDRKASSDRSFALYYQAARHSRVHKHDDDFGFTLYDLGRELLIDGGKYGYRENQERRYILSVRAHNAPDLGRWVKSQNYGSAMEEPRVFRDGIELSAKLAIGRRSYQRRLEFYPGRKLIVHDTSKVGERLPALYFLLPPDFSIVDDRTVMPEFQAKTARLKFAWPQQNCRWDAQRGSKDSGWRGWYSPSYGKLAPTLSLRIQCEKDTSSIEIHYERLAKE